jgi:serine/threonine-protein kinase
MSAEDPLDPLADSVLDGTPVDWDGAETRAAEAGLESSARALHDLARIAAFSRSLQRGSPDPGSPASESGPADPGESGRWGPFTLLEPVGAGASGEVWRAWDPSLQRDIAVKFLQPASDSPDAPPSGMLLSEARALARVRHPNVVSVYGIAEHAGRPGMWLEFLRGTTLAAEITRRGGLPPLEVARIGERLAEALVAIDREGLVHRDVKPANVVLESDGRVVLADFGLGHRRTLLDAGGPRGVGTPLFMTPGLHEGDAASPRTDLYALGVTLWWALAGRPPFRSRTLAELRKEVSRGPDSSLARLRPDAPRVLIEAIERAIDVGPAAARFGAAEMGGRLRDAIAELEPAASSRRAPSLPTGAPAPLSIAVLSFENLSRERDEEYFAEGLAEELLNVLSKIRSLRVASRTSSFQFKGRPESLATIGERLNVATILEGSVRRAGERIRIAVRLIQVSDGYHLWAESYDRVLDDIFAVQDEIAQCVLRALRSALLGADAEAVTDSAVRAEVVAAARGRGTSGEAHRLFLQGRYFLDRGSREETLKGIDYLSRSVALDPANALAWAELARARMNQVNGVWIPTAEGLAHARAAIERALALEPDLPEAHARLGGILKGWEWNWRGAEACYRRALELAPGSAVVLDGAGVLAETLGRAEEAVELMRRALEKDPLSAASHSNIGITYHAAGRLREAEEATRKAIELAPQRIAIHASLALILLDQGRADEAIEEALRESAEVYRLWALAIVHHGAGHPAESDAALAAIVERHAADWAYQVAEAHGARGEADAAFEWLERAYAQRDAGLPYVKPDPLFRSLHGDPRWDRFLAKMGLADP